MSGVDVSLHCFVGSESESTMTMGTGEAGLYTTAAFPSAPSAKVPRHAAHPAHTHSVRHCDIWHGGVLFASFLDLFAFWLML